MSMLEYVRLDVFTKQAFTGNMLAVYPNAAGLDASQMQLIANEMALPETTFVFPAESAVSVARVRIFTPTQELPMAGSPTIGTAFALAAAGRLPAGAPNVAFELGSGPTTVGLDWGSAGLRFAWMTQSIPTLGPVINDTDAVATALGVQPGDVAVDRLPVQVASSGLPFLYVPLTTRAAVDAAHLERTELCTLLRAVNLEELPVFVFSPELGDDVATVYSRMFAPVLGIPEDPATGSASGPLGGYLLYHNAVSANSQVPLVNIQGVRMGRPSRVHINLVADRGVLRAVRVGGEALVIGHGTLLSI